MGVPQFIAIDYETALVDGTPSIEFYREDFRVISCAAAWYDESGQIKSTYKEGEESIRKLLASIQKDNIPVIVHNYSFEYGVTKYRFDIPLNWLADTMRLVQLFDNGGKAKNEDSLFDIEENDDDSTYTTGLGLQASASRILSAEFHNHKAPYYKYLVEHCEVKKGKEGANLHLLPPDMLRAYNVADAEITLRIYNTIEVAFAKEGFDWKKDHALYLSTSTLVSNAQGRGLLVDLNMLRHNLQALRQDIQAIDEFFFTKFSKEIAILEDRYLEEAVATRKTEKGRDRARANLLANPELYKFNLNSTTQKKNLFVDLLQIKPIYFTKKGAPAFGRVFLRQWGEGGECLAKRGTLLIAERQMTSLLELAENDSKWHLSLKAAGARTGRLAGGSHG